MQALTCGSLVHARGRSARRSRERIVAAVDLGKHLCMLDDAGPSLAALTFVSPAAGATVSGSVLWQVSSPVAFDRIDFSIDGGSVLWTEHSCPCDFNGDPDGRLDTTTLANGPHTLKVDAYDASGTRIATGSETVTVSNGTGTTTTTTSTPTTTTTPHDDHHSNYPDYDHHHDHGRSTDIVHPDDQRRDRDGCRQCFAGSRDLPHGR